MIFRQWFDNDNDFEIESKYQRKTVVLLLNSSYLEFTRCCSSGYAFSYIPTFNDQAFYWTSKTKVAIVCDSFLRKPISIVHCLRKLGLN